MRTARRMFLLLVTIAAFAVAGPAEAGKPDNAGGGGGGGNDKGPSYQIIPLDADDGAGGSLTGSAFDINLSRLIVGSMDVSAAYWTVTESGGTIQSVLHFLDDSAFVYSIAYGCNEWGEVVGEGGNGDHPEAALYWPDTSSAPEELPASLTFRAAQAVNNNSVICGWSAAGFTEEHEQRALAWSLVDEQWNSLALTPLGDPGQDANGSDLPDRSVAVAISDEDDDSGLITIAGYSNGNAVIWMVSLDESGGLVPGPAMILDPGQATGVNNVGTVCGSTGGAGVVWVNGGTAEPLAFDDSKTWNSPQPGFPADVNDNGILVGDNSNQAVMWPTKDAELIVLDDFLPKRRSPFTGLTHAHAVNEADEIVGAGSPDGSASRQPFLAIPK